jgi:plastocyanin
MKRHPFAVLLALALTAIVAFAVVGCSGGGSGYGSSTATPTPPTGASSGASTSAGGATIDEQNFAFVPSTLTVKVGDTVTFTNSDSAAHNVKIDGQELGSQNQGESKTWKATKAGSFPFSCVVHPSMTGEITVQ